MRSKYINSTSGREYLADNGFSHIDFLYDVNCSRPTLFLHIFGIFTAHAQFRRFKILDLNPAES